MSLFNYIVRDPGGRKISASEESGSADELILRLQSKGMTVIAVNPAFKSASESITRTPSSGKRTQHFRHSGINEKDLALFCRQLATLLGAGVTILKSLDIVARQVESRKLYLVMRALQTGMEEGLSLHDAMKKHPKVFSEMWVNLVESGEAGGNLSIVLVRLAGYLEKMVSFKRKIVSALMYPCILFLAGGGALLFLTLKIIPTFATLFTDFNIELPLLTKIMIGTSAFLRHQILLILITGFGGGYALKQYLKTREGRRNLETLIFRLPLLADLFHAVIVERFCANMATLLESGVPILYSLEITERSIDNLIVADLIRKVKDEVREGKSVSLLLEKSGFFEPMVVQMVGIGEEIGELPQIFKKLEIFYQEYVDTFLERFTALFEPLMLLFMGGIIGLMIIGMFMPIFQIAQLGK